MFGVLNFLWNSNLPVPNRVAFLCTELLCMYLAPDSPPPEKSNINFHNWWRNKSTFIKLSVETNNLDCRLFKLCTILSYNLSLYSVIQFEFVFCHKIWVRNSVLTEPIAFLSIPICETFITKKKSNDYIAGNGSF